MHCIARTPTRELNFRRFAGQHEDRSFESYYTMENHPKWSSTTLEEIRANLEKFAGDRDWNQYHTPRNLMLALVRFLLPLTSSAFYKFDLRWEKLGSFPRYFSGEANAYRVFQILPMKTEYILEKSLLMFFFTWSG